MEESRKEKIRESRKEKIRERIEKMKKETFIGEEIVAIPMPTE